MLFALSFLRSLQAGVNVPRFALTMHMVKCEQHQSVLPSPLSLCSQLTQSCFLTLEELTIYFKNHIL